jgi:hypothetical protein
MMMETRLAIFRQDGLDEEVYSEVEKTGNSLFEFCSAPTTRALFNQENTPGTSSARIQEVFLTKALELGFQSEKKNLFQTIPTCNLRPDYFKSIKMSGIIIEVERGKTIMNNMDTLDMWKCHLCKNANHLFLFVPNALKHNSSSNAYDCFRIVQNRMAPFFEKENYTNVHSLWVFGY